MYLQELLVKYLKSSNQQELDKIQNLIEAINDKENDIKSLTDGDFKEKTLHTLTKNVQNGSICWKKSSQKFCH